MSELLDYEGLQTYHELISREVTSGNSGHKGLMSVSDKEKLDNITTMSASGTGHKGGLVPDPGSTLGTNRFLREDGTWVAPPQGGGGSITSIEAGTGLNGGTITTSGTISVKYGTTSGTACLGNDTRLSDDRNPTNHASNKVTTMTGYSKPSSTSAISTSDSLNTAIGKLEKALDSIDYKNVYYKIYNTSTTSTNTTLNYNNGPIQCVTLSSADLGSVSTSNIPSGHCLHVIFISSNTTSERSVNIAHDSTTSCCPKGLPLSLSVPTSGNGYTEVDFININDKIYVRGV